MTNEPAISVLPDFDSLWDYGDPAATEARFRELLSLALESPNIAYRASLLSQIARAQGLQQRFEHAHRTLDEVQLLLPAADARARIRYLLERGRVFNSSHRVTEAHSLFLAAWELACEVGEDFHAIDAAHMLAITATQEHRLEWLERATARAQASTDARAGGWLGSLYNNIGWSCHDLGRYEDALAAFWLCFDWQRAAGKEAEARIASWSIARVLRSLGRIQEALEMQLANLAELQDLGTSDGYVEEEIAECLLALGRGQEARAHFARAFSLLSSDIWLRRDEPDRLTRLSELAGTST